MKEYNITIRCEPEDLPKALADMQNAMNTVVAFVTNPRGMDHESDRWIWTLDLEEGDDL